MSFFGIHICMDEINLFVNCIIPMWGQVFDVVGCTVKHCKCWCHRKAA